MHRPLRAAAVAFVGALAFLVAVGSASGSVGQTSSLTVPTAMTAGDTNLAGSFTVINTNTPPNQAEANTFASVRLDLSCGAFLTYAPSPCPLPDAGVFALSGSALGNAGTACAGVSFVPSAPNASGAVTLTPSTPVTLAAPGGASGSDRCTVTFSFNVLRVPSFDVTPAAPGVQTRSSLVVQSQSSATSTSVTSVDSVTTTVSPATPTLSSTASNATLGQPIRDTATITSAVPAGPTGTVTFNLYAPDDPACAGMPIFSSTNPVGAGASAISGDFTPGAIGSYRWRASYSGDANHTPLPLSACNSPGETSVVVLPDTTAPQTTITSGPAGATSERTPTFAFSSDEAGSTFACSLDGAPFTACISPHTTAALASGAHTFAVRARDTAGNTDATPAVRSFTVVTTPAGVVTFDASPKSLRVSKTGSFKYPFGATALRSGTIGLKSTKKVKIGSKKRLMKLAAKTFTASSTGKVKVKFKLSSKNLTALKSIEKLRFVVTAKLGGKTFTTKLTLKAPKKA